MGNSDNFEQKVSVVLVTHNRGSTLSSALKSLVSQSYKNFEIIVVDNNSDDNTKEVVGRFPVKYIKLDRNYGPSYGRNIGIKNSDADIVIFLDDDAIADKDFVKSHVKAYAKYDIIGLRGKIVGLTKDNIYNKLPTHYDLGDTATPSIIDTEGNSSFKRKILLEIGGFNTELFGHEGLDISYRIIKKFNDKRVLIYSPEPVVYHDFCRGYINLIKKRIRYARNKDSLQSNNPELFRFLKEYVRFLKGYKSPFSEKHTVGWITKMKLKVVKISALLIVKVFVIGFRLKDLRFR